MKVLVTGGTGFVGSHLIEKLLATGDEVRAIVRPGGNRQFVKSLGAEVVTGDLDDLDSLRQACAGCDIIYHAAARVDLVGTEAEFQRTTVAGTARMLQAAGEKKVRRFIYLSSCGVYPPSLLESGAEINEFTPVPNPPDWYPYGRAKYQAERIIREKADSELEWVILRLGYLYGPRNRTMQSHILPAMQDTFMTIIGDGQNEMALIYIEDTVEGIVRAGRCADATGRTLIISDNEGITQQQYFDALADGFGMPRITKHLPYKVAFFFGRLGERIFQKGIRQSTIRRAAIALTALPQRIRSEYTRQLLGWRPEVPFAEGIRRTFEWYHAEYGEGKAQA